MEHLNGVSAKKISPPVAHDGIQSPGVPIVRATPVQLCRAQADISDRFAGRLVEVLAGMTLREDDSTALSKSTLSCGRPVAKVEHALGSHC